MRKSRNVVKKSGKQGFSGSPSSKFKAANTSLIGLGIGGLGTEGAAELFRVSTTPHMHLNADGPTRQASQNCLSSCRSFNPKAPLLSLMLFFFPSLYPPLGSVGSQHSAHLGVTPAVNQSHFIKPRTLPLHPPHGDIDSVKLIQPPPSPQSSGWQHVWWVCILL